MTSLYPCPFGQVNFKRFSPSKKIYSSCTTGWDFFLDPCILFLSWWTLLSVNLSFIARLIDWSINYNVIDFISGVSSGKFAAWLMFLFSLLSCAGSIYLGYILFYILHDTCVVCISTYVVNAFLLIINLINLKQVLAVAAVKKKKE